MRLPLLYLALIFALAVCSSEAKEIHPFRDGVQVEEYSELLARKAVHESDVFVLGDGNKFSVIDYIDEGSTTILYRVSPLDRRAHEPEQMALRLPRGYGQYPFMAGHLTYTDFINITVRNYRHLYSLGIALPELYRFHRGQFAAVEIVEYDFTLEDFLEYPDTLSPEDRRLARRDLRRFARRTLTLSDIEDFKASSLVYQRAKRRWVLIDWMNVVERRWRRRAQRDHVFGDGFQTRHLTAYDLFGRAVSRRSPSEWESQIFDELDRTIGWSRLLWHPIRTCASLILTPDLPKPSDSWNWD